MERDRQRPERAQGGPEDEILRLNDEIAALRTTNDDLRHRISEREKHLRRALDFLRHEIPLRLTVLDSYAALSEYIRDPDRIAELARKERDIFRTIQHQLEFSRYYQDIGAKPPYWQNVSTITAALFSGHTLPVVRDCPSDLEIYADPMMENVFAALLDNSLRHGERVTGIRISSQREDGRLLVIWEDNGTGVAPDEKEKIFECGFGKHNGFGLFLVREILGVTRITIHEAGSYGKGARFEMTVPEGAFRFLKETV